MSFEVLHRKLGCVLLFIATTITLKWWYHMIVSYTVLYDKRRRWLDGSTRHSSLVVHRVEKSTILLQILLLALELTELCRKASTGTRVPRRLPLLFFVFHQSPFVVWPWPWSLPSLFSLSVRFFFFFLSVWLPLATEHRQHRREHSSRHRDNPSSQLSVAGDDDAVWTGANGEDQWIDDGRDSLPFEVGEYSDDTLVMKTARVLGCALSFRYAAAAAADDVAGGHYHGGA